jgi:hypothetical protein
MGTEYATLTSVSAAVVVTVVDRPGMSTQTPTPGATPAVPVSPVTDCTTRPVYGSQLVPDQRISCPVAGATALTG